MQVPQLWVRRGRNGRGLKARFGPGGRGGAKGKPTVERRGTSGRALIKKICRANWVKKKKGKAKNEEQTGKSLQTQEESQLCEGGGQGRKAHGSTWNGNPLIRVINWGQKQRKRRKPLGEI